MQTNYNDGKAIASLTASITAIFRFVGPAEVDVGAFAVREAVVLAYPYLRATVGELWRLTSIPAAPLPTLDTLETVSVLDEAFAGLKGESEPPTPRRRTRKARGAAVSADRG